MLAVWAALLAAAVASAVGVVYARHESRRLFVELSALEAARDELNIDFGRLQLEQATWADANRIEKIARGELGMDFPAPTATRVVRR
ncbi:MAG: cell division protein FtsL [Pseudomonadota bacterium]|jgi:cell division protein FtsL